MTAGRIYRGHEDSRGSRSDSTPIRLPREPSHTHYRHAHKHVLNQPLSQQALDLIDGLNDHRPHVVHFSGHASAWGLLLENEQGSQDGVGLAFDLLARVLGATDEPPRLVVLNACESLGAQTICSRPYRQ